MSYEHEIVAMLLHPEYYEWRAHGIGFVKAYLDPEKTVRLNIWHSALITPAITAMHTHPWGLRSQIVAGELRNTRWVRRLEGMGDPYLEGKINCGQFNGVEGEPTPVWLADQTPEVYTTGMVYRQRPEEIHHTEFEDGTMTVMTRTDAPETEGVASVFWPAGTEYVDATAPWSRDKAKLAFDAALKRLL